MFHTTAIALFSLPLLVWFWPLKFELAKVVGFWFLSGGLIIWFLLSYRKKKPQIIRQKRDYFWLLWIGWLFLSTTVNQRGLAGLIGDQYRHQGTLFFLMLGIWSSAVRNLKKSERQRLWQWANAAIIIETFLVWVQWLSQKQNFPILSPCPDCLSGTLGEPNALAGYLAISLPFLVKSGYWLIFPFTIGAVILTGSKTGLFILLGEILISFYLLKKHHWLTKFLVIASLVLIIAAGIAGVWQERDKSPFESRWLIWQLGVKAMIQKPLLGYGSEGISTAYEKAFKQRGRPLKNLAIDRSHNLFLDLTLMSGVPGLFLFLLWLKETIHVILFEEKWRLALLTSIFIFSFFQPLWLVHWFYLIILSA